MKLRGIGFVIALAGCAAAVPARMPGATVGAVASGTVAPAARGPWRAVVVPATVGARWFAGESPDETFVVAGGVRAVVRGSDVRFVPQATFEPLVAMEHDGAHWYAFTRDGVQLRSDAFDGTFERVGETGATIVGTFAGAGTSMALASDGRVWVSTVEGPFHEVAQARNTLIDMGFVDGGTGVLITEPGQVFRTVDGGLHYARVALPPGVVAFNSHPDRASFVLVTSAGPFRLRATGDPVPELRETSPPPPLPPPNAALQLVSDRFATDSPFAAARRVLETEAVLDDGRYGGVVTQRDGRPVLVTWSRGETHRHALPVDGVGCGLYALHERFGLVCRGEHSLTVSVTDGVEAPAMLAQFETTADHPPTLDMMRDGTGVVVGLPCHEGEHPPSSDAMAFCHVTDGAAETVWVPGPAVHRAFFGDAFVGCAAGPRACNLYNLRDADAAPISLRFDRPYDTMYGALVARDRFVASVRVPDGRVWMAAGDPTRRMTLRRTPDDTALVFPIDATATLALALGRDAAGSLSVTADDGCTWSRVALPVDGEVSLAQIIEVPLLRSTGEGMRLGARVALVRPDAMPATDPGVPLIAARTAVSPAPMGTATPPGGREYVSPRVECTAPEGSPRVVASSERDEFDAVGLGGWIHGRRTGDRSELDAFGGADARGSFRVERPVLAFTVPLAELYVLAVTREMLLFARGRPDHSIPEELVVVGRTGALHRVPLDASVFTPGSPLATVATHETLVLDDRHVAALVGADREPGNRSSARTAAAALLVVDASGHATVVERVATSRRVLLPARLGGRVGIVAVDDQQTTHARFFAAPGTLGDARDAVTFPAMSRTVGRVCSDAERADDSQLELRAMLETLGGSIEPLGTAPQHPLATLRVSVATGDTCLAALAPPSPALGGGLYRVEARNGELVGTRHAAGADVAVRCRTVAPAR